MREAAHGIIVIDLGGELGLCGVAPNKGVVGNPTMVKTAHLHQDAESQQRPNLTEAYGLPQVLVYENAELWGVEFPWRGRSPLIEHCQATSSL